MGTVVVTGAGSGIGRATALAFAAAGHRVVAAVRDLDRDGGLAAAGFVVAAIDVADDASVAAGFAGVGRVDVLVNNAGIMSSGPVETQSWDEARHVFEVNYWGALRCTRAVLGGMRERGDGVVVNVSSVGGRTPARGFQSTYAGTKHALRAATEALAWEVAPFGVRVALIEPGFVATAIFERGGIDPNACEGPYGAAEAELQRFFLRGASRMASPAELVASRILQVAEDPSPPLYNPVGADAEAGIETARAASSYEAWQVQAKARVGQLAAAED